jgi:hypothetical protein
MCAAPPADLEPLRAQAEAALNAYHTGAERDLPLADLRLFHLEAQQPHRDHHQVTNRLLVRVWSAMQEKWPDEADFIEKRFFDRETMQTIARRLNISEGYVYTVRTRALQRFAETLYTLEEAACRAQRLRLLQRLDTATYRTLVGVTQLHADLVARFTDAAGPPLVLLEGIGGIGKSSLADAVTRTLINADRFLDVAWVSVQPQSLAPVGQLVPRSSVDPSIDGLLQALVRQLLPDFPLSAQTTTAQLTSVLTARLSAFPHLVVIDNLEALPDQAALADLLTRLRGCSRFLLTSRYSLPMLQTYYRQVVPPLSEAAAFALVRQEGAAGNLSLLATAPDTLLAPLYATVGGNPLALRLVAALTRHYDLATLLARLRHSADRQIDQLYTFIFEHCWQALDEDGRRLLLYMPLANSRGDTADWIATVTGYTPAMVADGLATLVARNLVDVHREQPTYRYSIHQLTRTFLLNDAIDWRT